LDKSVEAQVLNLLLDLKEAFGLTYIFISHDLNVVRYMSDRVMVMYLGQVVEVGDSETLFKHAAHPYTQALLSSIPTLDPDRRTETPPLAGDPPNPINPPSGCRFHTRCVHAQAICSEKMPVLAPAQYGQQVACWMHVAGAAHTGAPALQSTVKPSEVAA
jgi:peptide/nickel transport system ATP-binding protein